MTADNPVRWEADGDILVITIDNPPVNALRQGVRAGLIAAVDALEADSALVAGVVTRKALYRPKSPERLETLLTTLKPYSIAGLLGTVVLLFGLQAETIVAQPLDIVLISIPLLIQTYGIFAVAYLAARWWRVEHAVAAPCALIGTSNFFELAVAVAVSLFGLHSGAALATVVGVLVEVPVMLSLVAIVNRTRW